MNDYTWRKSGRSGKVNCVEVALSAEFAAVRDSKAPESGHLVVDSTSWRRFLAGLKAGRYDRDLG
ncbi:DUF397 domain-containing protein [Saccharopolyspora griseoalba]|uniref:DUF397 domain-containing protein n=1 Tax=Saccharopolyspora griseoalba TaxID=1431848 RepID=A0ABW2LNE8_9PSEU